jgi:hypothetical protein
LALHTPHGNSIILKFQLLSAATEGSCGIVPYLSVFGKNRFITQQLLLSGFVRQQFEEIVHARVNWLIGDISFSSIEPCCSHRMSGGSIFL